MFGVYGLARLRRPIVGPSCTQGFEDHLGGEEAERLHKHQKGLIPSDVDLPELQVHGLIRISG